MVESRREGPTPPDAHLSRRERQIMDVLWRRRRPVTVADVQEALPDPPSYSAVRSLLRILEEKGHLRHEPEGPRYVYFPTVHPEKARRFALRRLVDIFFQGSVSQAAAALLDLSGRELSASELDHLVEMIETCRQKGR